MSDLSSAEQSSRNALKKKKPRVFEKVSRYAEIVKNGGSIGIVQFQYNYACNFKCTHCSISRMLKPGARSLTPPDVKMIADQEAQPHHDQISKLEKESKEFVEEHREDLGKKKTKDLTFGQCGFRLSTSVGLPKGAEKLAEMIKKLRSRKMTECVVTTEKVDKEALKKYGKDIVTAVGATWKQKDTFWYDVNKETLERAEKGAV